MSDIPDDHPRAASLHRRHAITQGMHDHIVAEAGLIAHGRGEAFDYLIGEQTHEFAMHAIKAAAAQLYLAKHPVFSVNGNVVALCATQLAEFSNTTQIPLEINLFYRSPERMDAIYTRLTEVGVKNILGYDKTFQVKLEHLSSQRRVVDTRGIQIADVVFVPLEDGDRTEKLVEIGKTVITVDLNPLSRTAMKSQITIIDNITRVMPLLQQSYLSIKDEEEANMILSSFDNTSNMKQAMTTIAGYWQKQF